MLSINKVAIGASIALFASSVAAHAGHGGPKPGGSKTMNVHKRASNTASNYQAEASITSTAEECTAYYIEEVNALASAYPTIWTIASIPTADTYASSVFNAMSSGIPNIAPRGTSNGDFSGVTYDTSTDPDCWWTQTGCTKPKAAGIPDDVITCPEAKTWGLSFDDGPNCTHNAFYDFLQTNNQKATMCYIGSNVMDWPLQAQRGIADGHHIIGHTWSHMYMTSLTNEEVFAELYYSSKAIKDIMGISVEAWRPPYGDVDDRVRYIATQLGLKTILWDNDTDDWEVEPAGDLTQAQVEANYQDILGNVSSSHGTIVLTHEINEYTMELFMTEYSKIQGVYSHIVPLTACMNWTDPYQEGDITYPNFEDYVAGTTMPSGSPTTFTISSASYSPYQGGGSSVVAAEGLATGAASSASSSGSKAKSSSGSSGSAASASSGSSDASSTSKSSASGLTKPLAGIAAAVFGGVAFVIFA
ncbi:glycoside hydrolase/deacetylase [Microstroma glucosiphilum]|uniref:chitin deacetylase n=1 Tax=Pseudomicrostroma glucosiphilum TaxID=1684307 RepID=A0A316UF64_9BASI|nr:glycoside hydrolase/deacetylase [Pseudomicrostroma glucosiphilum]PWN21775.1 glycoside hydrolase/deacetylase [Pseudomicrostroma glucosiphilum]